MITFLAILALAAVMAYASTANARGGGNCCCNGAPVAQASTPTPDAVSTAQNPAGGQVRRSYSYAPDAMNSGVVNSGNMRYGNTNVTRGRMPNFQDYSPYNMTYSNHSAAWKLRGL